MSKNLSLLCVVALFASYASAVNQVDDQSILQNKVSVNPPVGYTLLSQQICASDSRLHNVV
ncbi:MAG: hypothetical protein Q4D14_06625 [Bacteroidales bacterium]|nr:hypothetical protein [Bacteroidales bacterium]